MNYKLKYSRKYLRSYSKLEYSIQQRIRRALEVLAESPYSNPNVRRVKRQISSLPTYRLRVGSYRIFYEIHNKEVFILVMDVKKKTGKSTYKF